MTANNKIIQFVKIISETASKVLPKGSQVALYGSRARGDARPDSDWDVLILIPGEEKIPLTDWDKYAAPIAMIQMNYDEMVNPRIYSYKGWQKRSFLPFYKNVENDKIIIFKN